MELACTSTSTVSVSTQTEQMDWKFAVSSIASYRHTALDASSIMKFTVYL